MNTSTSSSALAQGVKLIGIGKHGSKKLPEELIRQITVELLQQKLPNILIGAFFGALMMKDVEPSYIQLESFSGKNSLNNPLVLWNNLFNDTPEHLKDIGIKLLEKKTLTKNEAAVLGDFLFSDQAGECFRGMAMSVLRIRYETEEEYEGLYNSIIKNAPATNITFDKKPIIQLAEPFDGVEHSYMITPVLANELQKCGYNVVVACGQNGGPKFTLNTLDLYHELNAVFLTLNSNTTLRNQPFGWALQQKEFFPELNKWVERRKIIMKRPFLATLEKVLNPAKADILITSVFHIPYLEKMLELGFMAGFKAVIVLKRGLEGSLSPSLSKATGILCGVQLKNGNTITQHFDTSSDKYLLYKTETDAVIDNHLSAAANKKLIDDYMANGASADEAFNSSVKFATLLFNEGLNWIKTIKD